MSDLKSVLTQATSLDTIERTKAMDLLGKWEIEPMYHVALLNIYLDSSNSHKIRSLAVICLKNGIQKYWRKTAKKYNLLTSAIQPEERNLIKQTLLQSLDEPNRQLATQQAVITSKIARHDFPNEWPNLLDVLLPIVENSFRMPSTPEISSRRFNSLYTLHLVMKTMVTKALPAAKRLSQMITPNVFRFLCGLLYNQIGIFFELTSSNLDQLNEVLSIARITLKCLRRLIIHGYQQFSTAAEAVELVEALHSYLPRLIQFASTLNMNHSLNSTLQNMMVLIGKVYVDLSSERVVDFVVSPCFLNVVQMYWSLIESQTVESLVLTSSLVEKIKIQGMKMLKNITKHRDFTVVSKDRDSRLEQALQLLDNKFFVKDFVLRVATVLITRYMKLASEDLQLWEEDPESFVQEEESDHWEYHLRGCAEKLFMVLISKNRDVVCPLVMEMLQSLPERMDFDSLLIRESVYGAVAAGSHDLYDYITFDDWLVALAQQAQTDVPDYRIVKRRISNLLGKWISVKCSKARRPLVYDTFVVLLQPKEDIVVRLTAAQDLKTVVDDFDFEADKFQSYVQPLVDLLLVLMRDADEFDSRLKIIQCLIVIVERMEGGFVCSVAPLVQILPDLWTRSEGQNLFRTSVVSIIATLVKTLRSESYQLYPIVIPILNESLDASKPGHVYLLEEAMELWIFTLQNSGQLTQDVLRLVPFAIGLLELGTDVVQKAIHVLECYMILDSTLVLQTFASQVLNAVGRLISNMIVSASNSILKLIDTTLQSCHNAQCVPAIIQALAQEGVLSYMIKGIAGDDVGPIRNGYAMILCRLWIYEPILSLNVVEANGIPIDGIVQVITDRFDSLGKMKQRKLCALGLASIVGTGHPQVLSKMAAIVAILTSVGAELGSLNRPESLLFTFEPRSGEDDENSLDHQRRALLQSKDIVYMDDSLLPFIKLKFGECERLVGDQMQSIMAHVDTDLLLQLKRMIQ